MVFFFASSLDTTKAPPPEVVIILLPLKLKTPNCPKVPHLRPINSEPKASAASSNTGISYLAAIAQISSIFAGIPYKCTGIIAFGFLPVLVIRSLTASSSRVGLIFQVSSSLSTNTGVAP